VRCAIYTRKSSEEGLEQEFNSLDAQREAAEAFILSQRQEGWQALPYKYDDGGFTGANIERPALRKLLAEIQAGQIDSVVVYKVDRLSRSLLDFARLMEVFERHRVSFVSVTQQFNTSTPVGRLTLHILLSFAQFEREIISERTRDKKAAAKRKGKWTGGYLPLGYDLDPHGGKLVVNESEAEQVRRIFEMFADNRSVARTLEEVQRRGWKTKSWTTDKQRPHEGGNFTESSLRRLLGNGIYAGVVLYRGQSYRGEHRRIVGARLWKRAQQLLPTSDPARRQEKRNKHSALLQGLLHCGPCGKPMSHTSTKIRGRRYRYYVCRTRGCAGQSVPAAAFETSVAEQLARTQRRTANLNRVEKLIERVTYDRGTGQVAICMRAGKEKRRG
jgi:site-specific DNA recombinase